MFTTTMAALTMTGLLSTGAYIPGPTWVSDYSTALRQASEQGKPVAVFIGNGSEGFKHVLPNGALNSESTKILNDKYVTLFVDTSTEQGQATAKAFDLKEGLVISDKGGAKQALRHDGAVTPENLNKYISRYSETTTVSTTETGGTVVPASYGAPVVNPFSSCPTCQQGGYYRR